MRGSAQEHENQNQKANELNIEIKTKSDGSIVRVETLQPLASPKINQLSLTQQPLRILARNPF